MNTATQLLEAAHRGDRQATAELPPLVHRELRKLAAAKCSTKCQGKPSMPLRSSTRGRLRAIHARRFSGRADGTVDGWPPLAAPHLLRKYQQRYSALTSSLDGLKKGNLVRLTMCGGGVGRRGISTGGLTVGLLQLSRRQLGVACPRRRGHVRRRLEFAQFSRLDRAQDATPRRRSPRTCPRGPRHAT